MLVSLLRVVQGSSVRRILIRKMSDPSRMPTYHPDGLDKRILVHYKYFPTFEAVPDRVSESMMNQAKSRARIKFANVMIVMTLLGAAGTVYYARGHSKNYSLVEENFNRHKMYKKGDTGGGSRMGLVTNTPETEEAEE